MFDIVFPARGIKGFYPKGGYKHQKMREYLQATKTLADHGMQMILQAHASDPEEGWLFEPTYIVRITPILPRNDGLTFHVSKVTLEKLGVSDPLYTGKVLPQGRVRNIIETPQVEMWFPFSEVIIRLLISSTWQDPETHD